MAARLSVGRLGIPQLLLPRVSIPICGDISSLADVITQIKQNGLKWADSQNNTAIPRANLILDGSFPYELNLSTIDPPCKLYLMLLRFWTKMCVVQNLILITFTRGET